MKAVMEIEAKRVPEKINDEDMLLLLMVLQKNQTAQQTLQQAKQLEQQAQIAMQQAIRADGEAQGARMLFLEHVKTKLGIDGEFEVGMDGTLTFPDTAKNNGQK